MQLQVMKLSHLDLLAQSEIARVSKGQDSGPLVSWGAENLETTAPTAIRIRETDRDPIAIQG